MAIKAHTNAPDTAPTISPPIAPAGDASRSFFGRFESYGINVSRQPWRASDKDAGSTAYVPAPSSLTVDLGHGEHDRLRE